MASPQQLEFSVAEAALVRRFVLRGTSVTVVSNSSVPSRYSQLVPINANEDGFFVDINF